MRRIQLFIAASLDNYIARPDGAIDWLFTDQDYGYSEFIVQVDTVIMGRKTYDQVLTFGDYPYADKRAIVFSRELQGQKTDQVEFVGDEGFDLIRQLRATASHNLWLIGGGDLVLQFLHQGLVDQLILSIHPILLGNGIPLFLNDPAYPIPPTPLSLSHVKCFETGLLQVTYDFGAEEVGE